MNFGDGYMLYAPFRRQTRAGPGGSHRDISLRMNAIDVTTDINWRKIVRIVINI
jgi:hypothetical protein